MNQTQAIALAKQLCAEAVEADLDHAYFARPSHNNTQAWAVLELNRKGMQHVALWVSPELSFPL